MEETIALIDAGMEWNSYDEKFPLGLRPPRDLFARFVARKLKEKFTNTPLMLSLRIERATKNHLFLDGIVSRSDGQDTVKGEVVWMPNLNNFRGHLLVNPPSGEELERQEIEELRKQTWHFEKWTTTNSKETHGHCRVCWDAFYKQDESEGYTDGYNWLCRKCYIEHIGPELAL